MNLNTTVDLDSPPLTPSASDISDMGSLSDSEWLEVTSSSHASDTDDDSDDEIERLSSPPANPGGLRLALNNDSEWPGDADDRAAHHQSIAFQARPLADSIPTASHDPTDIQSFVRAVSDALQNEQPVSDPNVAHDSPSPDDFKLEFPDPLSSSSDDMLASNSDMASTGTWTNSCPSLPLPPTAESESEPAAGDVQPADLHIVVLGNRPNVLRTQRIVNVFVEAVGDMLVASHLVHHTHAARRTGPLFGTHEIAYGQQQTFRIVASDGLGLDKANLLPAHERTLALVFFSPTRITRSLPEISLLPAGTKFLPLIPSHGAQSPQSRVIASGDTFSFPSSVESSVLVGSPDNISSLSTPLHAKRVNLEWHALAARIPEADVLDIWPSGATRNDQVVMPTALLEAPAAMYGIRKAFFTSEVEEKPSTCLLKLASSKDGREERSRLVSLIRDYHQAWTVIVLISMVLAVFGSRYARLQNTPATSAWPNATHATTTAPPPIPSATEAIQPPPQSQSSTQEISLLPTSFRNLALSVFGSDDAHKAVAELPRPARSHEAQRDTTGTKAPQASNTVVNEKSDGASGSGLQTLSLAPSADEATHVPAQTPAPATTPLTLDAPPRRLSLPTFAATAWSREMRELMNAADDLLAAVHRRLSAAATSPAAEFVVARHARARHNARRIARRAQSSLRHVTDWSKAVSVQRDTRWVDRARRGVEGMRRVDWHALHLEWRARHERQSTPVPKPQRVRCSSMLCGVLGRDQAV